MINHPGIKEEIEIIFPFGSRVYGTQTEKSDEDYIIIVKSDTPVEYSIHEEQMNIFAYDHFSFQQMINEHHVEAVECYFSKENNFTFQLDKVKLRKSFSAVASNSFYKCRKKLQPGEHFSPYIAKKSLFHGLRIFDFGIQLAVTGKINNFASCNHYYNEIMSIESNDFQRFWERFEPIAQKLKNDFKTYAPLEKDKIKRKW